MSDGHTLEENALSFTVFVKKSFISAVAKEVPCEASSCKQCALIRLVMETSMEEVNLIRIIWGH